MRHLAALALSLGLLLTVVPTAAAHTTAQLDGRYNDFCNAGGLTTEPYGYVISRSSANTGRLEGARGKIIARALWPCVHGDATYTSKSLIWAADLQGTGSDGDFQFIQAGIGKVHYKDGITQCGGADAMVNDQTHFVYTPSATSGGVFCRASFVDFNNDGTPDDPVAGRTYDIYIIEYDSGTSNYWRVCFSDTASAVTDCKNITRLSADGGLSGSTAMWAGCEVGNLNNALGVPSTMSYPTLKEIGYRKASDGLWYWTESSSIGSPWHSNPSYYDWALDQSGLGEQLSCSTAAH